MSDTATTAAVESPSRPGRGRGVAAVILFIIGALLLPLGLTAFWGQRTLTDTSQYVATVAPLGADPAAQEAVANIVTDQITQEVNVGGALEQYFPPAASALVGPLTSALDELINRVILKALASPRFETAWVNINTVAQKSLISLLEGKQDGPIQTNSSGQIVLDTTAVYQAVRAHLIEDGVAFASKLPESPRTDRQIVLAQSDQLTRIQTIYSLTKPLATWLLPFAIILLVLALVLSRRRPRMLFAIGIAAILSAVLLKVLLGWGESEVTLVLQNTPLAVAEGVFFTTLTRFLSNGIQWLLAIGIALAVVGWLFGKSGPASSLRRWAGADEEHGPGFGGWLRRYGKVLAIAAAFAAVAIMLTLALTGTQLLIVAIAIIVIGVLLWFGRGRSKSPVDAVSS